MSSIPPSLQVLSDSGYQDLYSKKSESSPKRDQDKSEQVVSSSSSSISSTIKSSISESPSDISTTQISPETTQSPPENMFILPLGTFTSHHKRTHEEPDSSQDYEEQDDVNPVNEDPELPEEELEFSTPSSIPLPPTSRQRQHSLLERPMSSKHFLLYNRCSGGHIHIEGTRVTASRISARFSGESTEDDCK